MFNSKDLVFYINDEANKIDTDQFILSGNRFCGYLKKSPKPNGKAASSLPVSLCYVSWSAWIFCFSRGEWFHIPEQPVEQAAGHTEEELL